MENSEIPSNGNLHVPQLKSTPQTVSDVSTLANAPEETKISKNQQKKLKRQAIWESNAQERRLLKKEKKIQSKLRRRERISNGEIIPQRKKPQSESSGISLVIDLDFADKMTIQELKSTASQCARLYSANKNSDLCFDLSFCALNGAIHDTFSKQFPTFMNWSATISEHDLTQFDASKIVYLTADSPNLLNTLDNQDIYVIGGIVDRNRHKNICLEKAKSLGFRHAQLPIGSYIKLNSRKVLTINQVVEIMVNFLNNGDWETAFMDAIPKRKGCESLDDPEKIKSIENVSDTNVQSQLDQSNIEAEIVKNP